MKDIKLAISMSQYKGTHNCKAMYYTGIPHIHDSATVHNLTYFTCRNAHKLSTTCSPDYFSILSYEILGNHCRPKNGREGYQPHCIVRGYELGL